MRTYQDIESTANFYSPGIYDLLPRFSSLKAQADPLDGDFVPMTSVGTRPPKDALMFVVGILPPTSNVTGRLLDRSASIAAMTGVATTSAIEGQGGDPPSDQFYDDLVITANRMKVDPAHLAAVFNGESRTDPHRVGTGSLGTQAKGLNQMIRSTARAIGMSPEQWDNYQNLTGSEQLAWIEKSFGNVAGLTASAMFQRNVGGFPNDNPTFASQQPAPSDNSSAMPVGSIGAVLYAGPKYVAEHPDPRWENPKLRVQWQMEHAYEENKALDHDGDGCISQNDMDIHARICARGVDTTRIEAAKLRVGTSTDPSFTADILTGQALQDAWAGKGSAHAKAAQRQQQKIADHDLNLSGIGRALLQQQTAMIKATLAAIETVKNTPPLRMLVNPQSFKVGSEKLVADGNRSRSRVIVEHFGEQQDKIEASGKIAGFYASDMVGDALAPTRSVSFTNSQGDTTSTDPYPTTVGTYPGLTRNARQFSYSWQNFLSLYLLYKSNGALFLKDFYEAAHVKDTDATNLSVVGSIYIYYDNILYIGSFDTFTITEDEGSPFTVEYSFAFSVRASFLLDHVDDPKLLYGNPSLFGQDNTIPTKTSAEDQLLEASDAQNERLRLEAEAAQAKAIQASQAAEADPLRNMPRADDNLQPWLNGKGGLKTPGKNTVISTGKKGKSGPPDTSGWDL